MTLGLASKRRNHGLTGVAGVDTQESNERGVNAGNLTRGGAVLVPDSMVSLRRRDEGHGGWSMIQTESNRPQTQDPEVEPGDG